MWINTNSIAAAVIHNAQIPGAAVSARRALRVGSAGVRAEEAKTLCFGRGAAGAARAAIAEAIAPARATAGAARGLVRVLDGFRRLDCG